jgi:hypothetical protein
MASADKPRLMAEGQEGELRRRRVEHVPPDGSSQNFAPTSYVHTPSDIRDLLNAFYSRFNPGVPPGAICYQTYAHGV